MRKPRRPKRMSPGTLDYQVQLLQAHVSRMQFDSLKVKEKMTREARKLARRRKIFYIS